MITFWLKKFCVTYPYLFISLRFWEDIEFLTPKPLFGMNYCCPLTPRFPADI